MAHNIRTLVVSEPDARTIVEAFPGARRVRGGAGRWFVPLTGGLEAAGRALGKPDPEDTTPEEVAASLSGLVDDLGRTTLESPVVVLATEFFGGAGGQFAAVVRDGSILEGPFLGDEAVNRALRRVGVERGEHPDEFEAVGLHRWRFTADIGEGED